MPAPVPPKRQPRIDLAKLFETSPPVAIEAEMSLLGSLILDPAVTADVLAHIPSSGAFHGQAHAAVYEAILHIYDTHNSGDIVQLANVLRDRGQLDDAGGPDYLVQLAGSVPSAANAPHYARIVADKAKLRRLIEAAGQIVYDAYHTGGAGPDVASEVLDKAERLIFDIAEETQTNEPQKLGALLDHAMEMLEANEGRAVTGISTGFQQLDELTCGLQDGELVVVAARPSMGKTAFALNLAEQIAAPTGAQQKPTPVAIFSLEMGREAIAQRMMCARAGVDSHRVRSNRLHADDFKQLIKGCGALTDAPLYIDDTPALTILQLRAKARRMVTQYGVRCIVIDYLQLLTAPGSGRESRQVEVSAISRGVKALARELRLPVVCLSQLNRGAENREDHRPRMSDLRESGSIEQDADVVALLHREEYYHKADPSWAQENPGKVGLAELIIAKQRNGPTGVVEMVWDSKTTRFKNYNAGYQPQAERRKSA